METISWVQPTKNLITGALCGSALTVMSLLNWVWGYRVVSAAGLVLFVPLTLLLTYRLAKGRRASLTIGDSWVEDTSTSTGPIAFDDILIFDQFTMGRSSHIIGLFMIDEVARSYLPSSKASRLSAWISSRMGIPKVRLNVGRFDVSPYTIADELERRMILHKQIHGDSRFI